MVNINHLYINNKCIYGKCIYGKHKPFIYK